MKIKVFLAALLAMFLCSTNVLADDQEGYPCGANVNFFDYSNWYDYERDAYRWCDRMADLFSVAQGKFCVVNYDRDRYQYQGYFDWPFRFEGYDAWDVYKRIGERHLSYVYRGENFRTKIHWDGRCRY